jgi:hypothetical protein
MNNNNDKGGLRETDITSRDTHIDVARQNQNTAGTPQQMSTFDSYNQNTLG